MITVEAPINTTAALPEGLDEIIYASVERALAALLPHRRCRNRRSSKSRSKSRNKSRSRSRSKSRPRSRGNRSRSHSRGNRSRSHSRGNRSRSHSRGKHGHRKGPHHRIVQSESETEGQQMEFKGHKGRHGMKHGYHFMRHGHHGMRHGHHGMRHGHNGMRHGRHHGMRHCRRFPFLACGSRPADQQKEGNEEPVEVVDLVAQEEIPSVEGDLQRGLENMNVGDNASVAGSDKQ